jgi:16S rRNA (cytosine1402-N4)-methyltransferase
MISTMENLPHRSVLLSEVVDAFHGRSIKVFVDGTLGIGGHAEALLKDHPEIELYLGIDQDPHALTIAADRLKPWESKVQFRQGNFSQFDQFLNELHQNRMDGILVDLGVSSMQLDQAERGFSFSREGPLDMRMDPKASLTAAIIVNTWSEKESVGEQPRMPLWKLEKLNPSLRLLNWQLSSNLSCLTIQKKGSTRLL